MNHSILYVEDEEDYAIVVGRVLARRGYVLRTAQTGAEGFSLLRAERPALLLLDVNLPDMEGYAFCRQLREDRAFVDLPVLMLTVRRRPEEWLRGFSCGANDYLSKPFDPSGLLERVDAGLAGKTLRAPRAGTPEYQLIGSAVAGNRAAFAVLICKYRERLSSRFERSGWSSAEAEDIVAHAFLCAFETLDTFRGESSFYTWLYRIAMNEACARRRPEVPLEEVTRSDELAPGGAAPPDATHAQLLAQENREHLERVLRRVPVHHRKMLELYFLRDLSYGKIACKLRIPIGTVMSRLHKARGILKSAWAEAATPR